MKNAIKPGDTVTLGAENGLGRGHFLVLEVSPKDVIHRLTVRGKNGLVWSARLEGAKVVAPRGA